MEQDLPDTIINYFIRITMYNNILPILLFIINFLIFSSSYAEITTDGSLGTKVNLPGPNFQIEAELGQQHGGNLFHSFQNFNLQNHESATFSGASSVQNVISRVTGGNPSIIDGIIRSTIPNADMYFLNPDGIIFGENVKLDVQGSFNASTADYLRLQDGGRFEVRYPNNSLLTVAPVEAFGFLDNAVAGISIKGVGELSKMEGEGQLTGLAVPSGKTLSIIGGDIEMNGSYYRNNEYIREYRGYIRPLGNLTAPSGRINLVSVASTGVVIPTSATVDVSTFEKLGNITLSEKSLLESSGIAAGSIFIRAAQLVVSDASQIFSHVRDDLNNNDPFPHENEAYIDIAVQKLSVIDESWIAGYAFAVGDLGDILIHADDISLKNGSWINSQSYTSGNTGDVSIQTRHISIEDGGIGVIARDTGKAGQIHIQATETISVSGVDSKVGWSSGILSITTPTNKDIISGKGGDILLETGKLVLKEGAQISSSSIAGEEKQSQNAGNITIQATGAVHLSGVNPYGENENGLGSGIYVRSKGVDAGNAGTIAITANTLSITDGAEISGSTAGHGQGGYIHLDIRDTLSISGDSAHIVLQEPKDSQLQFQRDFSDDQKNRIAVSGIYGSSLSDDEDAGEAGTININTYNLNLTDGASINTSTQKASGGHITLTIPNILHLQGSNITTSVYGGTGDGGNITIEKPQFIVLNQGQIKAQADAGRGGNIRIVADQFIASPNSIISASSRLGVDGNVNVEAPDDTVSASLIVLSGDKVDASAFLKKPCSKYVAEEERNHFYVHRINGVRPAPHDRQGSGILPASPQTTKMYRPVTNTAVSDCQKLTRSTSASLF